MSTGPLDLFLRTPMLSVFSLSTAEKHLRRDLCIDIECPTVWWRVTIFIVLFMAVVISFKRRVTQSPNQRDVPVAPLNRLEMVGRSSYHSDKLHRRSKIPYFSYLSRWGNTCSSLLVLRSDIIPYRLTLGSVLTNSTSSRRFRAKVMHWKEKPQILDPDVSSDSTRSINLDSFTGTIISSRSIKATYL